ncbi:MAG TPA: YHS domain-containing (seleno)protein [Thermoanaerobaculia bacterium]|jgi:YHS domain-containing protein|nr:YHS domain-containing (seleno)protein [Thermoanaerobaculia bacterium]
MRHRFSIALLAVLAFSFVFAGPIFGAPPIEKNKAGLALDGWDTVSYFDGKPVPGKAEFAKEWGGATWRFASAAHRDAFAANPAKYAPQYGGYCAYGLAKGKLVEADPTVWKVVGGKLYVNYDRDVQESWEKKMAKYIVDANAEWQQLGGKP